jgi:NADH dehydrogenase
LVHIYFLIGFRNRLQVLWEWAWAYFRFQRGARLITGRSDAITPVEGSEDAAQPGKFPQAPPLGRKAS